MGHRKMSAYGEREHNGRYVLDDYEFSRNHTKAETIRRWRRDLKKESKIPQEKRNLQSDAELQRGVKWHI